MSKDCAYQSVITLICDLEGAEALIRSPWEGYSCQAENMHGDELLLLSQFLLYFFLRFFPPYFYRKSFESFFFAF